MKKIPFSNDVILKICNEYSIPFYMYHQKGILESAAQLYSAFNGIGSYQNFFAVKALPNPEILKILINFGMGLDCSSLAELYLAEKCGLRGDSIIFTSNNTSVEEFKKADLLGAIINFDDVNHLDFYIKNIGHCPLVAAARYNPGSERAGNEIIGKPEEAKFGMTKQQVLESFKQLKEAGVSRIGLHTMLASNELDSKYIIATAKMMFDFAIQIKQDLNLDLDFINLGGGFGIPYRPDQKPINLDDINHNIRKLYTEFCQKAGYSPRLMTECGRFVTGPNGYLVTRVLHIKDTYKKYIGLDATMANLMRPGMYGAYHFINILGKEELPADYLYDVTGSLCENNDKFAIDRQLPEVNIGDIVIIHDAGAHGHSMGFNYNGKLRSAEFLVNGDDFKMIRRAETLDDYFATLEI